MEHETLQVGPGRVPAGSDIEAETIRRGCQSGVMGVDGVLEEAKESLMAM